MACKWVVLGGTCRKDALKGFTWQMEYPSSFVFSLLPA